MIARASWLWSQLCVLTLWVFSVAHLSSNVAEAASIEPANPELSIMQFDSALTCYGWHNWTLEQLVSAPQLFENDPSKWFDRISNITFERAKFAAILGHMYASAPDQFDLFWAERPWKPIRSLSSNPNCSELFQAFLERVGESTFVDMFNLELSAYDFLASESLRTPESRVCGVEADLTDSCLAKAGQQVNKVWLRQKFPTPNMLTFFHEKALTMFPQSAVLARGYDRAAYLEQHLVLPMVCRAPRRGIQDHLTCATEHFYIGTTPINPRILEDLTTWLSDADDQVVAINLLGSQKSNRYNYDESDLELDDESVLLRTNRTSGEYFEYEYIGKSNSGIHAVKTTSSGGGSGRFMEVLLLSIDIQKSVFGEERLVITKAGSVNLGDRWAGTLEISGNKLLVGEDVDHLVKDTCKETLPARVIDLSISD